jgi:uncharacterized membrane protein
MTFSASDRGALSTFMAVIAFALLMSAGLAVDGGRKVNALREASHLADNAARAGAQAVDLDTLRSTGQLRLLPDQAIGQVDQYLERLGHTGEVTVSGDTITVTISLTVNPILLPTGPITVTATETATAITQEP